MTNRELYDAVCSEPSARADVSLVASFRAQARAKDRADVAGYLVFLARLCGQAIGRACARRYRLQR